MPKFSELLTVTAVYTVPIGDGDQKITCRALVERLAPKDAIWADLARREQEITDRIAENQREITKAIAAVGEPNDAGDSAVAQFMRETQGNIDAIMLARDNPSALDTALLAASDGLKEFQAKVLPTPEQQEARYLEAVERVKGLRTASETMQVELLEVQADRLCYLLSPLNGWDVEDDEGAMMPITRDSVMRFSATTVVALLEGALKKVMGRRG